MSRTELIPATPAQAFACRSVLSQDQVLVFLCKIYLECDSTPPPWHRQCRRWNAPPVRAGGAPCHSCEPVNGAAVVAWLAPVFASASLLWRPFLFFLSAVGADGIGTGGKQCLQNEPCFF